jgi:hypothetical protein
MARMRGFFLRVALPSPTDIGHSFSTMSYKIRLLRLKIRIIPTLTYLFRIPQRFVSVATLPCWSITRGVQVE